MIWRRRKCQRRQPESARSPSALRRNATVVGPDHLTTTIDDNDDLHAVIREITLTLIMNGVKSSPSWNFQEDLERFI